MRPTNHLSNPSSHPHVPDETTTTTQTTPPHVSQDTSHRHSHSNTSKHLYTYHFNTSKIPHSLRLTYRSRAKAYLKQNGYFVDMEIFQVVSSILFFFVFIAELICNMKLTQNPTNRGRIMISGFYFVDLALCLGVLVMLLIGLLVAKHKKRFILQLSSLIDIFTIVPLIPLLVYAIVKLFLIGGFNSQIFYRNDGLDVNMFSISIVIGFFRLLRLIRILFVLTWKKNILNYMFENSFGFGPSLQVQVVTLILIVIILLLFFSGTFHLIEFLFGTAVLGMLDSIYFMVITMATIGYGDITPTSMVGKYWSIFCFLVGVTVIPYHLSALLKLGTSETALFRAKHGNLKNHIIVSGYFEKENIIDFLREFYHSMHGKNNKKALIVSRNKELIQAIKDDISRRHFLSQRVLCYTGDLLDYDTSKLLRVHQAHSVFFLNCTASPNPRLNDTSIMMSTIAIKNINRNIEVYAQVTLPESRYYLYNSGAKVVVCTEMLSSKLAGMNVLYHGFSTMVINLVSTLYIQQSLEVFKEHVQKHAKGFGFSKYWKRRHQSGSGSNGGGEELSEEEKKHIDSEWLYEYFDGYGHEIYSVSFSPYFNGMKFIDVAIFLREQFDITLFALEFIPAESNGNSGQNAMRGQPPSSSSSSSFVSKATVELNPSDHVIDVNVCKAFVIAQSAFHANLVYLFENANANDESSTTSEKTEREATTGEMGVTPPLHSETLPHQLVTLNRQQPHEHDHFVETAESEDNDQSILSGQSIAMNGLDKPTLDMLGSYESFYVNEENDFENIDQPNEVMTANLKKRGKRKKTRVDTSIHGEESDSSGNEEDETESVRSLDSMLTKPPLDFENLKNYSELELNLTFIHRLFRSVAPSSYFMTRDSREDKKSFDDFCKNMMRNYNLLLSARPKEDFIVDSAESVHLRKHIIVTGEIKYPLVIVATVRSLRRRHFIPILIVVSKKVQGTSMIDSPYVDFLYERLKFFDKVFLMRGSPTDLFDLQRAGITNCETIVYLSRPSSGGSSAAYSEMVLADTNTSNLVSSNMSRFSDDFLNSKDYFRDAEAVKIVVAMSYIDPRKFFVLELNNTKNIKFLKQIGGIFTARYGNDLDVMLKIFQSVTSMSAFEDPLYRIGEILDEYNEFCLLSELYSSGRIIPVSFISKLLAQSFYTEKLNDLVEQMCIDGVCSSSRSSIFQESCPELSFGMSVGTLFVELCRKAGLILLALYRPKYFLSDQDSSKTVDEDFYYVYTHPRPNTVLQKGDIMFLCGRKSQYIEFIKSFHPKTPWRSASAAFVIPAAVSTFSSVINIPEEVSPVVGGHELLTRRSFDTFMSKHKSGIIPTSLNIEKK
ncbi:hypothetical protein FDP41_009970 [Naegleria fowleri]|uniref:Potassium channel domain-containing protein n=1 Tax=Naegleria fowleri TaxID=5763 RepID=A0A6A5AYZ7_NAEFO|nr:uncharacterized protein FDP41_009970 [Naegleria fowleri]KAF0971747.1 hypothetical protein FDP41_009970 [Naegleria fowleri]